MMTLFYFTMIAFYLVLGGILVVFAWGGKSGKLMEWLTALCLRRLDRRLFRIYNDVLLPDGEGGTTQVDHLVVCSGGLYLIESKCWGGSDFWVRRCKIYANAEARRWKIYYKGDKNRARGEAFVPNPLLQNYKHHLCLSQALGIPSEAIHPMIALPGFCEIMKAAVIPGLYCGPVALVADIRAQAHGSIFSKAKIKDILLKLDMYSVATTHKAKKAHVKRLKRRFSSEVCPRCGGMLVSRTRRKTGEAFIGCTNYPRCRYTR